MLLFERHKPLRPRRLHEGNQAGFSFVYLMAFLVYDVQACILRRFSDTVLNSHA